MAAALPGAAAFGVPAAADPAPCLDVDLSEVLPAVEASSLIVIGTVETDGAATRVLPEAFLDGAASSDPIALRRVEATGCELAEFANGDRVLLFLYVDDEGPWWPNNGRVFWLENGRATPGGSSSEETTETELIRDIRHVTEQYAIPAANQDEGAGIDWWSTIVPVGAASLGLLAVGLYLMRIWHRIDPS